MIYHYAIVSISRMKKLSIRNPKGFTIIEVLIVLAIAGLILLIIFMAIPSVRAAQRDNQRRRDLAKFFAAVKEYQVASGSTNTPFLYNPGDQAEFTQFKTQYLGPEFSKYDIDLLGFDNDHSFPHQVDRIVFFPEHYCPTNSGEQVSGPGLHPPYAFAVLMGMERTRVYLCFDNGNRDLNE